MSEVVFFDLWEHACLPPDQIDHPLALGRSRSAEVLEHMQLSREELFVSTSERDHFLQPHRWTLMRGEMIELLFDPDDIWQSMSYGAQGDVLTWQVESAITREAGVNAPYATAGEMPLALRGRSLGQFATLPNFMSINAFSDAGASEQLWSITGREYDKWLSVVARLPRAIVSADFLLKVNKSAFESRFEIDYCLHRLHIGLPWPVESALSAHPA